MRFRLSDWVYVTRQDVSGMAGPRGWSWALVLRRKWVVGFGHRGK